MKLQVTEALTHLFQKHRIVFWYDDKQELRKDFESVQLDGVEKVEINENEFQLKHRMMREQPDQNFLLFKDGPQPEPLDNWLLDVQLAHGEFRADQAALWLTELGLGLEFSDLITDHFEFFKSGKRREDLLKLDIATDIKSRIRTKMLAVCAGSDSRVDSVLEALLAEAAEDRSEKYKLVERCQLDTFLWERAGQKFAYRSETPSPRDFVIELFKSCYAMGTDGDDEIRLNAEALVFLKRWKDSIRNKPSFEQHSRKCADVLDLKTDLGNRDFRKLAELDYFELIDKKILSDLARNVTDRTIPPGECTRLVRQRRQGHWYDQFQNEYEAVDFASQLLNLIDSLKLDMQSLADGVERYTTTWHQVDQLYRSFVYHFSASTNVTLLKPLAEVVENWYSNRFLLLLGDRWQGLVDEHSTWEIPGVCRQRDFYQRFVRPYLSKNIKVFVIISDGLRYEIGHDLAARVRQEDRYSAELKHMVTGLPSYTQLGMAALLPNSTLEINHDKNASVSVDGHSSMGTANRGKILQKAMGHKHKATALQAKDLLNMNRDESRELISEHDVVYVYQNLVDDTGDKAKSEHRVFQAAEEAMTELVSLVKKLVAGNASNILITADHGFLYQSGLAESDFAGPEANSVPADRRDRRFLLGANLETADGLTKYTSKQVGLTGDMQVALPKSINRLRLKGSGFRYVHGGSTLQEVIVPVIEINKSRKSDVSQVDIDVIRGNLTTISTGQLSVLLYQKDPVSEKLQPRTVKVAIYAKDGTLISDSHEICFDLKFENAREREHKLRLVLSRDADKFSEQQVMLKLEEKIPSTSHYQEYASHPYTLRKSFERDFDF